MLLNLLHFKIIFTFLLILSTPLSLNAMRNEDGKRNAGTKHSSAKAGRIADSKKHDSKTHNGTHHKKSSSKRDNNEFQSIFLPSATSTDSLPVVEPYSIPTTSSPEPSVLTTSSEEIMAPPPAVVNKFEGTRTPKHAAEFEKKTGHKSASSYTKAHRASITNPEIGHVHGYQNHGAAADSRSDNLAVISKQANLKMNIADNMYKTGDVDANFAVVKKKTRIATHFVQQQANPSNQSLALTPATVLPANMGTLPKEQKEEFKKKVQRANDPKRKEELQKLQEKNPENFLSIEDYRKKVCNKRKEDEKKGKTAPDVYKFSDQSRSKRRDAKK